MSTVTTAAVGSGGEWQLHDRRDRAAEGIRRSTTAARRGGPAAFQAAKSLDTQVMFGCCSLATPHACKISLAMSSAPAGHVLRAASHGQLHLFNAAQHAADRTIHHDIEHRIVSEARPRHEDYRIETTLQLNKMHLTFGLNMYNIWIELKEFGVIDARPDDSHPSGRFLMGDVSMQMTFVEVMGAFDVVRHWLDV